MLYLHCHFRRHIEVARVPNSRRTCLFFSLSAVSILRILRLWHDTSDAMDLAARHLFVPMFPMHARNLAPRKWILGHVSRLLRPNLRPLSRHGLGAGQIRRDFVMQCKNFSEKVAKKFFVVLFILPQKFHEPRAWYDSATASFARGPCTKVKKHGGYGAALVLVGRSPYGVVSRYRKICALASGD
jgi:hypothetical protein